jgi:hypothetical protein
MSARDPWRTLVRPAVVCPAVRRYSREFALSGPLPPLEERNHRPHYPESRQGQPLRVTRNAVREFPNLGAPPRGGLRYRRNFATAAPGSQRMRRGPTVTPIGRPHRSVSYRLRSRLHLYSKAVLDRGAACGCRNAHPNFAQCGAESVAASARHHGPSCARCCAMSARGSARTSGCDGRPSCAWPDARNERVHDRSSSGACRATSGPACGLRSLARSVTSICRATMSTRCLPQMRRWHTPQPCKRKQVALRT